MIAGGSESCIHPLAISGFARARSLAIEYNDRPTESSRPFDRDRDGFVIGEGAGVVVLEVHWDVFSLLWKLMESGARACETTRRAYLCGSRRLWAVKRCLSYDIAP